MTLATHYFAPPTTLCSSLVSLNIAGALPTFASKSTIAFTWLTHDDRRNGRGRDRVKIDVKRNECNNHEKRLDGCQNNA